MESVENLLIDIGDSLSDEEVQEVIFLLKNHFPGKLVICLLHLNILKGAYEVVFYELFLCGHYFV